MFVADRLGLGCKFLAAGFLMRFLYLEVMAAIDFFQFFLGGFVSSI